MPFVVTMPKLSPTMEGGMIVKWHKKIGDRVAVGELLVEIATDKATIEFNALENGFLRKILIQEGQTAPIHQPIAIFTAQSTETIEHFQIPSVQEEKVHKKEAAGEKKSVPCTEERIIFEPAFVPEPPLKNYTFAFPTGDISERIIASPLAKKIAKEKGLDLSTVTGTGPKGRIVSRDLELAQKSQPVTFGRREKPDAIPGSYREIPLSPMRKVIGERLQEAKRFIPHFYIRQELDALPLMQIREQLKSYGIPLTVNDFIIRAAALSLREHPYMNSGYNSVSKSIILFQTVDIAVAVTVEGGLFTPIIRHADYKNIGELSVEMKELSSRAKAMKLESHEYKGGSFTISNLGIFGISDFTPIINPPQSAILAVGGIEDCVRMKPNGKAVAGKRMNLVLACDHRVIDGAEGAKFIKTIQKYLENPAVLVI